MHKLTLYQAIARNGLLIYGHEDLGLLFFWNGSKTINVMTEFNGRFQSTDTFTNYNLSRDYEAIEACEAYCANVVAEFNEEYA